mmetsp:Transcript_29811/g.86943  ORF Transcript_29811/g.86943 Transcript_29811/m.86943 type:complete len:256 (-) Transcript_29811:316-1083(-)
MPLINKEGVSSELATTSSVVSATSAAIEGVQNTPHVVQIHRPGIGPGGHHFGMLRHDADAVDPTLVAEAEVLHYGIDIGNLIVFLFVVVVVGIIAVFVGVVFLAQHFVFLLLLGLYDTRPGQVTQLHDRELVLVGPIGLTPDGHNGRVGEAGAILSQIVADEVETEAGPFRREAVQHLVGRGVDLQLFSRSERARGEWIPGTDDILPVEVMRVASGGYLSVAVAVVAALHGSPSIIAVVQKFLLFVFVNVRILET